MKYHAPTKKFIVNIGDIEFTAMCFIIAIKHIRKAANLPMEPYVLQNGLTESDHAQKMIIDAADRLGIDLGAKWGNELDLREV